MVESPPCQRCGTFTSPAELDWVGGKRVCGRCRHLERFVWHPWLLLGIGAVVPPGGLLLAMINWYRLGFGVRMLQPVLAGLLRVLLGMATSLVMFTLARQAVSGLGFVTWGLYAVENAAMMAFALLGQWHRVTAQREGGGQTASLPLAFGLGVAPFVCLVGSFVGFYQFFSRTN